MLSLQGVSKKFKAGNYGVRELTLTLDGGVLGLLGPNGAGKTTLMQMIATVTRPTAGQIRFQGEDIVKHPEALRPKLGYLPQDFGTYGNLSAEEHLTYFSALKGVHSRSRIGEMLERVNLHTVGRRLVGDFSGGMKQRLGIAQALINDPDLLIVDEPTAGLDPEERVRFRHLLTDLGQGKLVILSTHIVSDIEPLATRVAVMRQGRLIAHDTPEALLQATRGRVWEATVSSEEYEALRSPLQEQARISTAVRKPEGMHVKLVAEAPPVPGATPATPTLEDAFLDLMREEPCEEPAS